MNVFPSLKIKTIKVCLFNILPSKNRERALAFPFTFFLNVVIDDFPFTFVGLLLRAQGTLMPTHL
jgi:hypothetical protein